MKSSTFFLALALVLCSNAHMQLSYPPPFRSKLNPYANENTIDYSMTSPITAAQFPCKGYQTDFSDSKAGTPTASFSAGGSGNITIIGGATHGGGSCQIALSYDVGKSFMVIQSIEGGCPMSSGESFNFEVPSDAPTGKTMLAWVWYNKIGNREIYMNCASVTIATASGTKSSPKVAFSSRPSLFLANLDNGCTTVEGTDVKYPNPGPDLTGSSTDSNSIIGTCQAVNGVSSGPGSDSSGSSASQASKGVGGAAATTSESSTAAVSATISTVDTSAAAAIPTSAVPDSSDVPSSSTSAASAAGSTNAALTTTSDGQCSGAHTCQGSSHGPCCSKWGWCGFTSDYCGDGCQTGFGSCRTTNATLASAQESGSSSAVMSAAATSSNSAAPLVATVTEDVSTVYSTSIITPNSLITSPISGSVVVGQSSISSLIISGFITVTTTVSFPFLSRTGAAEVSAPL